MKIASGCNSRASARGGDY